MDHNCIRKPSSYLFSQQFSDVLRLISELLHRLFQLDAASLPHGVRGAGRGSQVGLPRGRGGGIRGISLHLTQPRCREGRFFSNRPSRRMTWALTSGSVTIPPETNLASYTHVCLGFYHGFYLLIGACFSSGLYLQLLILKNGRGIMVNPPIIRGVDHLAPPTFPSSKFCNRPREPLMTSHNRPR